MTALRWLTSVHGHVAVLAIALLFHPTVLAWRGQPLSRGARYAVALSGAAALAAFGGGVALYGDYREHVRPSLFIASTRAGLLFETKEHIGFMVVAASLGAAAAMLLAPRGAAAVRRASARLFLVAGLLALAVGAIGTYVTGVESFR